MADQPHTPVRKTRREQQAETRAQVIAAARGIFLERGYHGASLSAVVDAAGFTKGAVYSNFSSKAELALAVLGQIEEENVTRLGTAFQGLDEPSERARVLTEWGKDLLRDRGTIRLRSELNTAALDDPALATTIVEKSRGVRAAVEQMLRGMPNSGDFLLDVDVLASALVALSVGVGSQRLMDPEYDLRAFVQTAGVLTGYHVRRTDRDGDAPADDERGAKWEAR